MTISCLQSKKMTYEFPEAMTENVRKEYLRQCEKGAVLFDISCAKCHTKKTMFGKKIYDFTSEQLYSYEIRRSNKTHENTLTSETVTTEELGYIIVYLQYKKRSGMPFVSSHKE
jgi:hypothetical protein